MSINHYDTNNYSQDESTRYFYGTYPGRKSDLALMMNSHDVELQHSDSGQLRGILRNKHEGQTSRSFFQEYDTTVVSTTTKTSCCGRIFDHIIRPCLAELFSVIFCIFIYNHVDTQLSVRHLLFFNRILVLSAVDALLFIVFLAAFQTVHLSPSITIAQLFSLSTPWYLCILFFIQQFIGAIIGISLFYLANSDVKLDVPKVIQEVNSEWTKEVFELIISQFIGTIMVVITHLMITRRYGKNKIYTGRVSKSPLSVFGAVLLSAFLSLLHSNISWNPLYAFALSLHNTMFGSSSLVSIWQNHYIFWLGPTLGALFGCFLFSKCLSAPTIWLCLYGIFVEITSYTNELHKKLAVLQSSSKFPQELENMSEKIYNMVKNSEKKDGKDCFTIVEKMLAKIQKPSSKLYYDWVYKEFLRHLTDGYYYTALLFLQEATKSSLYNIKDIASELRSIYFLNKVLEGEKSLSKEFFYYLVENEKDAEKIADLFNRYAALTNASGTSSIRKFLDAVLNAHKNRTDNLYDRFLMFKEVTQIAQNSYVHQNFIEDFLFKLCTHVNFHIDNDRRKYALFFTLMGYDLSSLRPAMFYQYFLRAFKTMYGSRTKNEFDLLDNFYQNMQSYGMKSWVVWELLDSYISLMKKERMFEKDLYLQALERWLESRKEKIMKEKEDYVAERSKNSKHSWLEFLVYSENFQELHNFLTKYGWPEETIVSKIAGNILNLYIEHADWAQTKFLIHILSDEYLKNLKNSNTSFNRSNLKTINLTRGQIFSILHKRFDESEDFSKTLDALYELKRLFPISFNEFSKNSESVRKQYRDNEDNQNFKDFIYPFLIYLKEKSYRCPEITNKVQAFELIHVLERLHLTDYKRISQRRQAELLLFHLFHINDINKWYQFWSLLPTKTSQADIFFGLLRQYYWHMNGRFVMKQGNEAAENFNNVLIPIIDEAKSMLTPAEYYFIDMFAIISVIKTMGQSDRIHPEQLTDLLEYKPIAHQSKEELFKGLEFAIKMVSELSKNNTYFSLTECIKFAMKHPLVKQTASRPDFWYKIKFSIINKILGRDISGVPLELYELFKNNQMHIVTKQLDGILRKTIEEKEILEHYIYNADTSVFNVGDLKNDGLAPKKKFDDLVEELRLDASKKKLFPRYEDVLEE